jgi:hypothetical protein
VKGRRSGLVKQMLYNEGQYAKRETVDRERLKKETSEETKSRRCAKSLMRWMRRKKYSDEARPEYI